MSDDEVETGIGPVFALELIRVRCVSVVMGVFVSVCLDSSAGAIPPDAPAGVSSSLKLELYLLASAAHCFGGKLDLAFDRHG